MDEKTESWTGWRLGNLLVAHNQETSGSTEI